MTKICKTCGEDLPLESFHLKKGGLHGRRTSCADCTNTANKSYVWASESSRTAFLKYTYGITDEDYDILLDRQNDACAGCKRPSSDFEKRLHIDHDHACCPGTRSCGQCIRGLLCMSCNTVLGKSKDDPRTLRSLAEYLER